MLQNSLFQRFYRKYNKIILLFPLVLLFLGPLIGINIVFKVRTLKINNIKSARPIFGLDNLKENNLLLIDTAETEKKIKEQNSFIKQIFIRKKLPSSLIIDIENYEPLAYISINNGYFILAEDGRILKKTKTEPDIVLLEYYQKINESIISTGNKIFHKDIIRSLFLLKNLQDLGVKINSIDIKGFNMILFKIDNKEIIFNVEKSKEQQLYELGQIIRQFKIEGKEFKRIDLRFDKPVITY